MPRAPEPVPIDTFNGMISNVQLYNRALTPSQIQNIYDSGPSGIPIQNDNIIGWWPLDGTVDDYSGYGNNGTSQALFASSYYGSPSGYYLASFNQSSNALIPHSNAPLINAPFSVSFMFSTVQPYTANFLSELVDGEQPSGYALNISLCGGALRTACPNGYGLTTSIGTGSGALGTKIYKFSFSANTLYDVTETFGTGGSTLFINGINVSYFSYSGTPTVVGGNKLSANRRQRGWKSTQRPDNRSGNIQFRFDLSAGDAAL